MKRMQQDTAWERLVRGWSWDAAATSVFAFGIVLFLGLEGGGFDPLVHDQVGIAVWWILLLAALVGAIPRLKPTNRGLVAIGFLFAFVVWTALSLRWTESTGLTSADLARVLLYLGVFTIALGLRASAEPRRLVGAVTGAIVVLAVIALLSRLHPAWFPSAEQTANLLPESRERLSYPLNYWNGLGALIAIGVPLVLTLAASARTAVVRGLAAAAFPALCLTIFFTLSRGSIAAAGVGTIVYLAFARDRLPKFVVLGVGIVGAAILVAFAAGHHSVREGLADATARHQGNELLLLAVIVCALVGLVVIALTAWLGSERRPVWTYLSRGTSQGLLAGTIVVLIVAFFAAGGPHRVSHAWNEFRHGEGAGFGTQRLNSLAGESRTLLWRSALAETGSKPLTGTGSGTFALWWTRDARGSESVQDAHSLYLQTLGELGIVGFIFLTGFILTVLIGGGVAAVRAGPDEDWLLAAALAGCLSFFISSAVDWTWQIPAIPISMLLLAAVLVGPGTEWRPLPWAGRIGVVVLGLLAILAIAVPLASTSLLRSSQSEVREGNLEGALEDARSAQNIQPGAGEPRLQEALVLELRNELDGAAEAAREATDKVPTDWRNWLVLSRIEAERGRADGSVAAYRKARSLDPLGPLFNKEEEG
jgi:O-antigen ligase